MIGAPVIIQHQDITEKNADELRCGAISDAYFNDEDGWYYCEGVIWDKKAQKLIDKGWSVSCSYDFLGYDDEGGVENNIKYNKEFTKLNFTHLAIVNNPRYERANIVFNSKDDEKGRWVTIKGTHVFIPDGKSLDDVMAEKGWTTGHKDSGKAMSDTKNLADKSNGVGKETPKERVEKAFRLAKKVTDGGKLTDDEKKWLREDDSTTTNKEAVSLIERFDNNFGDELTDEQKDYWDAIVETSKNGGKTEELQSLVERFDTNFGDELNEEQKNYLDAVKKSVNGNDKQPETKDKKQTYLSNDEQNDVKKIISDILGKGKAVYASSLAEKLDKYFAGKDKNDIVVSSDDINSALSDIPKPDGYSFGKDFDKSTARKIEENILKKIEDKRMAKKDTSYTAKVMKMSDTSRDLTDWAKDLSYNRGIDIGNYYMEGYIPAFDEYANKDVLLKYNITDTKHIKDGWHSNKYLMDVVSQGVDLYDKSGKFIRRIKGKYGDMYGDTADDMANEFAGVLESILKKDGNFVVDKSKLPQANDFTKFINQNRGKTNNAKEQNMELMKELKNLIRKIENNKGEQEMDEKEKVDNENVDKRKLIDEVGGILKGKVDEEVWRTVIGKLEKLSYDKSEAGSADNKKVKNEDDDKEVDNEDEKDKKEVEEIKEDVKEDVENKCKNSKSTFDKINAIYNSVKQLEQPKKFVSRQDKLDCAVEYFK